ncbi:MAG: hypothetical protein HYV09_14250 [Deltaproteobacteria bacterium]|nr:hypothetical protein [Deltaproteobacteria bacterium]
MRERAGKTDDGTDRLRITDQFRTRAGMVYELRQHGARLTLLISERSTDDGSAQWCVEASSNVVPGTAVEHSATTKADALRMTGVQWVADCGVRGLPTFDWEAVARALTAVRAI